MGVRMCNARSSRGACAKHAQRAHGATQAAIACHLSPFTPAPSLQASLQPGNSAGKHARACSGQYPSAPHVCHQDEVRVDRGLHAVPVRLLLRSTSGTTAGGGTGARGVCHVGVAAAPGRRRQLAEQLQAEGKLVEERAQAARGLRGVRGEVEGWRSEEGARAAAGAVRQKSCEQMPGNG